MLDVLSHFFEWDLGATHTLVDVVEHDAVAVRDLGRVCDLAGFKCRDVGKLDGRCPYKAYTTHKEYKTAYGDCGFLPRFQMCRILFCHRSIIAIA
jgi:hypothetical protein